MEGGQSFQSFGMSSRCGYLEHLLRKAVPWSEFHGQAAIATPTSGNDH